MKLNPKIRLGMLVVLLSGCSCVTPINNVHLPPVTTIEGAVEQVHENGFSLKDQTGSIFVKAKLPGNKPLGIVAGDNLKVYGNLQGGEEKIFDGYVIKKPAGQQIIVTRPSPHFGFVIQSAFE